MYPCILLLCRIIIQKADLVARTLKYVTSYAFCNLIGPPRSLRTDPKRYSSLPDPLSLHVHPERTKRCGGERETKAGRGIYRITSNLTDTRKIMLAFKVNRKVNVKVFIVLAYVSTVYRNDTN